MSQPPAPLAGKNIAFVHIPKTGGQSVAMAMKTAMGADERGYYYGSSGYQAAYDIHWQADRYQHRAALLRHEQFLMQYFMRSSFPLIYGHLPYSPLAQDYFKDEYAWVTVLRKPVDRFISNIIFLATFNGPGGRESVLSGKRNVLDTACEYLGDKALCAVMAEAMSHQLGGLANDLSVDLEGAHERVLDNLKEFALIGFLDQLETFVDAFEELFGLRLEIGHAHDLREILGGSDRYREIKETLRNDYGDRIRQWCSRELEVYAAARERFASQQV